MVSIVKSKSNAQSGRAKKKELGKLTKQKVITEQPSAHPRALVISRDWVETGRGTGRGRSGRGIIGCIIGLPLLLIFASECHIILLLRSNNYLVILIHENIVLLYFKGAIYRASYWTSSTTVYQLLLLPNRGLLALFVPNLGG